jgi:DNA-binding transcriptional ArsR family regulator
VAFLALQDAVKLTECSDLARHILERNVPKNDPLQPQRCAELLSALAAPERLKIVRYLADGERNVGEIAEMLEIPLVNVSHHLNVLKQSKMINGTKHGRFVLYSLCPGILEEATEAGIPEDALNLGCCKLTLPAPVQKPQQTRSKSCP